MEYKCMVRPKSLSCSTLLRKKRESGFWPDLQENTAVIRSQRSRRKTCKENTQPSELR